MSPNQIFFCCLKRFVNERDNKRKKQLVNYIDGHIYERIALDELAVNFDKHKTHLTSVFKKEMNQTFHNYILNRKINESKHLLLFTDKSYKEISIQLAFASQSHFIQIFKKSPE